MIHDHIVVGSGMSGAHAAQTLVEGGRQVLMLDAGLRETHYTPLVPDRDFVSVRESDAAQHRYFLGDAFEGVPWGEAAHTLTPPRQHLVRETGHWLPLLSRTFQRMESLCYGGLGAGWGAGAAVYTPSELDAVGLDPAALPAAYRTIAARIGLAAEVDDATPYCGAGLEDTQPPLRMDRSISKLHSKYLERRNALRARGVVMGKMPMAVLTRDLGGRRGTCYPDMEFWADPQLAVYRPWMTVDALNRSEGFRYEGGRVVVTFREQGDHVAVETLRLEGGERETFLARRLVLGTGTLGTARIVLRSLGGSGTLPLLTNGYCIAPCLHLAMLGQVLERERTSLGQLEMFLDPGRGGLDVRMVSLYTYRSLLLFKLIKEVPLALSDGRTLMHALSSAIVLATINHPDHAAAGKSVRRIAATESPTGDALAVEFAPTGTELADNERAERRVLGALARLGCHALKRQSMPSGSTVHYAGTLPFANDGRPFTIGDDGRLAGTRRVHVVDGSGFRYLPANGPTLTLMANAHRIAARLCGRTHDE